MFWCLFVSAQLVMLFCPGFLMQRDYEGKPQQWDVWLYCVYGSWSSPKYWPTYFNHIKISQENHGWDAVVQLWEADDVARIGWYKGPDWSLRQISILETLGWWVWEGLLNKARAAFISTKAEKVKPSRAPISRASLVEVGHLEVETAFRLQGSLVFQWGTSQERILERACLLCC